MDESQPTGERLAALLDHFGIGRVNVALGPQSEAQAHDLVQSRPTAVASMAVLARLVAASFEPSESEALSRAMDHGSSVAFHANPLHAVVGHKTAD